ncbi:MAG TPA: anti-sigma factor [Gaiellaceae bacterium]|nr:anti-sigma factor [Gaiellaceae bacterium]
MNEELHDLVAPYALDALDDDERAEFERHLAQCEQCRAQLAELQEATTALAYAAEGPEPPAELRERILEAARENGGAQVIQFPKRPWLGPAAAVAAAVAAVAAIAIGLWAASLKSDLDREREARRAEAKAIALLASDAERRPLSGGRGALLIASDGSAALVTCDLATAPEGKAYEAWVIADDAPRPAGLFRGADDCDVKVLTRPVPRNATVAVTLEGEDGSDQPTSEPLFAARPA